MLKKILAVVGTLVLAAGVATIAVVAPASATRSQVTAGAITCGATSGTFDIPWTVTGDPDHKDAVGTITAQSEKTKIELVGQTVQGAGSVSGVQTGVAANTSVTLEVKVHWDHTQQENKGGGSQGEDSTVSLTVTTPGSEKCITGDATASVTTTAATCSAPASLNYGALKHATFTSGTADGTSGPKTGTGTSAYSVTFTADAGHTFADGKTTMEIAGNLAARVNDASCDAKPAGNTVTSTDCLPVSSVSYTYDSALNSGTITVKDTAASTHVLCKPFWVTATSWKYVSATSHWPQMLDSVQKVGKIDKPGTYNFAAPVACGQGDIYASFAGEPNPTAVLDSPGNPFPEPFLHAMGFSGPTPTWVVQDTSCVKIAPKVTYELGACYQNGQTPDYTSVSPLTIVFDNSGSTVPVTFTVPNAPDVASAVVPIPTGIERTVPAGTVVKVKTTPLSSNGGNYTVHMGGVYTVTIPDSKLIIAAFTGCLNAIPGDPTHTNEACVSGEKVLGSITVGLETGLTYKITGPNTNIDPVTTKTTTGLVAGDYVVAVKANPGYILTGADNWPFTVLIAAAECGTLTPVTPTAQMSNHTCSAAGSFTLDPVQGVVWKVDGVDTAAGTHQVTDAKQFVITAVPAANYMFPAGTTNPATWTFVFSKPAPETCQLTTLPLPQLPTLAFTGVGTSMVGTLAGGLVFLVIGGVLVATRRFRS